MATTRDEKRATVLARFVSGLGPDDEELLRTLLDDGREDPEDTP
ncbi:hypothetical protein [Streptomyces sp. NBC_01235]